MAKRSSFGDLELSSLVTTPPSRGSCSLIGRIVCVAVAVRDAGTEDCEKRVPSCTDLQVLLPPPPVHSLISELATLAHMSGLWWSPC